MLEFLMGDLQSLWGKSPSTRVYWWAGSQNVMCDIMLDRLVKATRLCETWKLCEDRQKIWTQLGGQESGTESRDLRCIALDT